MSPSQKLKKKLKKPASRKAVSRKHSPASPKHADTKRKKNQKASLQQVTAPSPRPIPVIRAEDWAAVWKASLSDNEDEEWLSGKI